MPESLHTTGPDMIIDSCARHRDLRDPGTHGLWTSLVTRIIPAGSAEFKSVRCGAALEKERTTLRGPDVWDEDDPHEWAQVRGADAEAMCGRVFAIMGDKRGEKNLKPKPL